MSFHNDINVPEPFLSLRTFFYRYFSWGNAPSKIKRIQDLKLQEENNTSNNRDIEDSDSDSSSDSEDEDDGIKDASISIYPNGIQPSSILQTHRKLNSKKQSKTSYKKLHLSKHKKTNNNLDPNFDSNPLSSTYRETVIIAADATLPIRSRRLGRFGTNRFVKPINVRMTM